LISSGLNWEGSEFETLIGCEKISLLQEMGGMAAHFLRGSSFFDFDSDPDFDLDGAFEGDGSCTIDTLRQPV